jgi:hypothetical protein
MILYPRRSLEPVTLAHKGKDRGGICGLRFKGNKTMATNGHVLITTTNKSIANKLISKTDTNHTFSFPTVNGVVWDSDDRPFTIETDAVKSAIKNLPNKSVIKDCPFVGHVAVGREQGVKNNISLATIHQTIRTPPIDARFPDTTHVIPNYDNEDYIKVGLSCQLLKDITTLLAKNHKQLTLHIHKEKSEELPIVITAEDTDFHNEVILMPVRLVTKP